METDQVAVDRYKAEQALKSAASWFAWIGGLSILNSIMATNGTKFSFTFGLGISQIGDAWMASDSPLLPTIGFFMSFGFAGFFILLSWLARHTPIAFPVGIAVYALDSAIFLVVQDWVGFGFHVFALAMTVAAWRTHRKLAAALPPLATGEAQPMATVGAEDAV
jgi:hypothetical protein